MLKKKTPLPEPENEPCPEKSENILENVKYIKKLTMQRMVLSKLVDVELQPHVNNENIDAENPGKQ